MLIPVTASDTPDFTAACAHEHIFGSRALTALVRRWTAVLAVSMASLAAAALYLADGVLTISSDERADPAPIADLIRRMQVHEVDTNWTQCQALQNLVGGTTESSYYMVYRGAPL